MSDSNYRDILLNLESTLQLNPIARDLNLDANYMPVKNIAGEVVNQTEKFLTTFPRIKEVRKRVKTIDSTLFKMLYMRTSDLNKINDVAGLIALVEDVDNCYALFHELLEGGLKPYLRLFDSLDKDEHEYRSLDVNLLNGRQCFQVQIRTIDIQSRYNGGYLSAQNYKKRRIDKFKRFLRGDEFFGIDFRMGLLRVIETHFREGYRGVAPISEQDLISILGEYSSNNFDYNGLKELRLNKRTHEVLQCQGNLPD